MAHDKTYVVCENMCMEEGMTKEEILNTCVVKDNIAVITGTITMTNGSGSTNINYPDGFNKDNCVVISAQTKYAGHGFWAFGCGIAGSFEISGQLTSFNVVFITHSVDEATGPTGTYECKVVLMKI